MQIVPALCARLRESLLIICVNPICLIIMSLRGENESSITRSPDGLAHVALPTSYISLFASHRQLSIIAYSPDLEGYTNEVISRKKSKNIQHLRRYEDSVYTDNEQ